MEKKGFSQHNSFRSIFGIWNVYKYISRRLNLTKSALIFRNLGFTLLELIVVIAILGILFAITVTLLDPARQFNKLNDAKRETDIKQITQALDTFYNDNNCYPINDPNNTPTGLDLLDNSPVYIKNVPLDPQTQESYLYISDPADCPQWNVMFAKLNYSSTTKVDCPLVSDCLPANFGKDSSGYNYCVVSGSVDCNYLSNVELVVPIGAPLPGNVTDTLTPIVISSNCGVVIDSSGEYILTEDMKCNKKDAIGIYITDKASNVVLDCQNHNITGEKNADGSFLPAVGIQVIGRNSIIKNCNINVFFYGVLVSGGITNGKYLVNTSLSNITVTNNASGIFLSWANGYTLSSINTHNNSSGVYFYKSTNNVISSSNISNNQKGVVFSQSTSNKILNNTISNNQNGVVFYDIPSNDNIFCGNIYTNNGPYNGIIYPIPGGTETLQPGYYEKTYNFTAINPTVACSVSTPTPTPPCSQYWACTQAGTNGCNELSGSNICNFNGGAYQCYCSSNCNGQCH